MAGASGNVRIYTEPPLGPTQTTMVVASGGRISVEAGGEIKLTRQGIIALDIFSGHIDTTTTGFGPVISSGSVPALAKLTTTTGAPITLNWASAQASAVVLAAVPVPIDYDAAATAALVFYGEKASGTDTVGINANIFWGATSTGNLGTTTPNLTSAPTAAIVGIASGNATSPAMISISFWPGTHANDALSLYGAWIRYNRRI